MTAGKRSFNVKNIDVGFLRKLIYRFRLFLLRRKLGKISRIKRVVNYSGAESFVILFEADNNGGSGFIGELARKIEKDGKRVSLIGFSGLAKSRGGGKKGYGFGRTYIWQKGFWMDLKASGRWVKKNHRRGV